MRDTRGADHTISGNREIKPAITSKRSAGACGTARRTLIAITVRINRAVKVNPFVYRLFGRCEGSYPGFAHNHRSQFNELPSVIGALLIWAIELGLRPARHGQLSAFKTEYVLDANPRACKRFVWRRFCVKATWNSNHLPQATMAKRSDNGVSGDGQSESRINSSMLGTLELLWIPDIFSNDAKYEAV